MLDIRIDTRRLNAAMQEMARESRKDLDVVVREQAGIMVGHLIAMTPPAAGKGQAMNDRGGIELEAKKRGESAIAADLAALFPTTKLKDEEVMRRIDQGFEWGTGGGKKIIRDFAETEEDLRRIHQSSRSPSTGRVRTGRGQNMALTRAAVLKAYKKKALLKVGHLNAGWLKAARELRTAARATPAWITRHGAKGGGFSILRTQEGLNIAVSNNLPYFPKDMNLRVQRVVFRRGEGLRKALEAMVERKAQKARGKMGG